jgi:hypothetical protein
LFEFYPDCAFLLRRENVGYVRSCFRIEWIRAIGFSWDRDWNQLW